MLRQNGGCQVTIAAPTGLKMTLAKQLDAADVYVELSRTEPEVQFEKIKKDNPYGFDIVVEATGSAKILEDGINYVRRGGTLVCYGSVLFQCVVNDKLMRLLVSIPTRPAFLGHRARFLATRSELLDLSLKHICFVRYLPVLSYNLGL